MSWLITEDGVSVDALDKEHMTAVHYASKSGNGKAVSLLLSLRADINRQNLTGWTPLALAGNKGHVHICCMLIEALADVNIHAHHQVSCLHRAAARGNEELAELFVRNGADFRHADGLRSYTAVHHAAAEGNVGCLLFFVGESRERLDYVTKWGETVLHLGKPSTI